MRGMFPLEHAHGKRVRPGPAGRAALSSAPVTTRTVVANHSAHAVFPLSLLEAMRRSRPSGGRWCGCGESRDPHAAVGFELDGRQSDRAVRSVGAPGCAGAVRGGGVGVPAGVPAGRRRPGAGRRRPASRAARRSLGRPAIQGDQPGYPEGGQGLARLARSRQSLTAHLSAPGSRSAPAERRRKWWPTRPQRSASVDVPVPSTVRRCTNC